MIFCKTTKRSMRCRFDDSPSPERLPSAAFFASEPVSVRAAFADERRPTSFRKGYEKRVSSLYRTATTAYPCSIPRLGDSAGAGRIRLTRGAKVIIFISPTNLSPIKNRRSEFGPWWKVSGCRRNGNVRDGGSSIRLLFPPRKRGRNSSRRPARCGSLPSGWPSSVRGLHAAAFCGSSG